MMMINRLEIGNLKEGLHVEFKESYDSLPKNLFETICAFLNTEGGTIYLGIDDTGKIKGIKKESIEMFLDQIASLSNNPWASLSNEELLKIAGFTGHEKEERKQSINLAGILVFGSDEIIREILPAYKFDCLLRRNNVDRYDDRLIIDTNLICAFELMMGFAQKHMNDPFYLEGEQRVSLRDAIFREAISNIIAHRDYTHGSPARFIISQDSIIMDNPCTPHYFGKITPENLVPFAHNPVICRFMIQLGRFDQLGSGVRNIHKYLPLYSKGQKPTFEEVPEGFRLILPLVKVTPEVTPEVGRLLEKLEGDCSKALLMEKLGLNDEKHFRETYLKPAIAQGYIEMTIPDKPNSKNQKYRMTEIGKKIKGRNAI